MSLKAKRNRNLKLNIMLQLFYTISNLLIIITGSKIASKIVSCNMDKNTRFIYRFKLN